MLVKMLVMVRHHATASQLKEIKPTLDVDRCQTGGQKPKIK